MTSIFEAGIVRIRDIFEELRLHLGVLGVLLAPGRMR